MGKRELKTFQLKYLDRVRTNGVAVLKQWQLSRLCFSPPQPSMYCIPPYILDTTDPILLFQFYGIYSRTSHQESVLPSIYRVHFNKHVNMAAGRERTGSRSFSGMGPIGPHILNQNWPLSCIETGERGEKPSPLPLRFYHFFPTLLLHFAPLHNLNLEQASAGEKT